MLKQHFWPEGAGTLDFPGGKKGFIPYTAQNEKMSKMHIKCKS